MAWEGLGVIEPVAVAKVVLKADSRAWPRDDIGLFQEYVSEQQYAFMEQRHFIASGTHDRANLYRYYMFYAVSEKDARKTAERFIELADQRALDQLGKLKKDLIEQKQALEEADKRIPKLEEELKPVEALEEAIGERYKNSLSQAKEQRFELYRQLGAFEIEIAGYQAQVDTLKKHGASTSPKIYDLRLALGVELAGAEARKKEVEKQLAQVKDYILNCTRRSTLRGEVDSLKRKRNTALNRIPSLERQLNNLPSNMQPVEVFEDRIVIHPMKETHIIEAPQIRSQRPTRIIR